MVTGQSPVPCSKPRKFPWLSNVMMVPLPRFPTSSWLACEPKVLGASVMPHGESISRTFPPARLPAAKRLKLPVLGSNTSINPRPGAETSFCFVASCFAKVTKTTLLIA